LAYHYEETESIDKVGGASSIGTLDAEATGCESDGNSKPEPSIRGKSGSTKGIADSHLPVNQLISRKSSLEGIYVPHASKKLHKASVSKSRSNHNAIHALKTSSIEIEQTQDKRSQGKS
jgi:hypothetical protein